MKKKLNRSLGLYSAIMISIGAMAGSIVFVLAGTSYEIAGPSAALAVFLSGIGAFFTAFSFCELVSFIPKAGGGYSYVRDALGGGPISFISGWGFWLGFSIACGLFALGFGVFLNYFFPSVPPRIGAYGLIIYIVIIHLRGIESFERLQNVTTTILILLLSAYSIYAIFYLDLSFSGTFFSEGITGTFTAMALLYVTYIGFGFLTTASEEVNNPKRSIPKAILISMVLAIIVKTVVFFIGSGILGWNNLVSASTSATLIDVAIEIAGSTGGLLLAFAGILATVSSMNTGILAASRTSLAVSRDGYLPSVFRNINSKTSTPFFSIIMAGVIVFIVTVVGDLQFISAAAGVFALVGYTLVNFSLIVFRKNEPDAERSFKTPLFPITPIAGILVNVFLIFLIMFSEPIAFLSAFLVLVSGLGYYYYVRPKLKSAPKGISTQPLPSIDMEEEEIMRDNYNVLATISNPDSCEGLINMGNIISSSSNGILVPMYAANVPKALPISFRHKSLEEKTRFYDEVVRDFCEECENDEGIADPISVFTRDVSDAIINTAEEIDSDFIMMGWHRSGMANRMIGGIVDEVLEETSKPVGVFKKGESENIDKILYPFDGGYHSISTANILKRIVESTGAEVTMLNLVEEEVEENEKEEIRGILRENLNEMQIDGNVRVLEEDNLVEGVVEASEGYDLLVMGMSSKWGLSDYITGPASDNIMENISCNGLVVRGKKPVSERSYLRGFFDKFRDFFLE